MKWLRKVKEWFVGLFERVNTSGLAGKGCRHTFAKHQIWERIAPKRFELQNKVTCTRCSYSFVDAIE
jgi:hypothetical protein